MPVRETTAKQFQKECSLERGFQLNHEAVAQPFCPWPLSPPSCSQQVDGDKIIATSPQTQRILFFACCCQKLFQLLTGYREVKLGNSARRIAHLAGFKPIPSPCNTESGPGEISSGSPCEISRLESFVLSFPLTYFLSLMAHF